MEEILKMVGHAWKNIIVYIRYVITLKMYRSSLSDCDRVTRTQ